MRSLSSPAQSQFQGVLKSPGRGLLARCPDSHRGVVRKVARMPTLQRMLYTCAHTPRQQRARVCDSLSGPLTAPVKSPRPSCQSEGLVWWQDRGCAWSNLGAVGEDLYTNHPQGRMSAAAIQPCSCLSLARTRLCWNPTAFCKCWPPWEVVSERPLHCSSLFPPKLVFRGSRVSKPRSTCFSRHSASIGFCLRLPASGGGWWVVGGNFAIKARNFQRD